MFYKDEALSKWSILLKARTCPLDSKVFASRVESHWLSTVKILNIGTCMSGQIV